MHAHTHTHTHHPAPPIAAQIPVFERGWFEGVHAARPALFDTRHPSVCG